MARDLSERDICTQFITPAVVGAGWGLHQQVREEVTLTAGRVIVRGKLSTRGRQVRADYVLYHQANVPIAVIEAKDQRQPLGGGMQQALAYAEMLDVPFVFASNGSGFLFHDKTATQGPLERELALSEFPSPDELWRKYKEWKGLDDRQTKVVGEEYHSADSERVPRYYQAVAINRVVTAVAQGKPRVLLVMATGTGKTYTAFQIIWRLWKSRAKKRILFLADRNILVDQTRTNDFQPFGGAMTKVQNRTFDPSYEIHLALYQAITGPEEADKAYKALSRDFFDLIVVDECHRGSAAANSAWREVLDHFSSATQIGLTATPKETEDVSSSEYFGAAAYTYSLRQGIDDGFLAPYKVIRFDLDRDLAGYRPEQGTVDRYGHSVADRVYRQQDFDRNIVLDQRTTLVAQKISEFLKSNDRYAKTIVFCEDTEHAERMRQALANENSDLVSSDRRYVMRITGDDTEGRTELENFADPLSVYPVVATTSKLLTTGVDIRTLKLIVLDQRIASMTEFKQIIGRGTRIDEEQGKRFFTIMDFKRATELFADPAFDGDPVQIFEPPLQADIFDPAEDGDPALNNDSAAAESDLAAQPLDEPRKYYLDGVEVNVSAKRVQYMGADGKMITESLRSYTRGTVHRSYRSLDEFLQRWNDADRRQAVVQELEAAGVPLNALREEVSHGSDMSTFDLLLNVAFDRPVVTRRDRVARVRQRAFLDAYGGKAREVLEALLNRFADDDSDPLDSGRVLQLRPFDKIGTPVEIINGLFGGKARYRAAVHALEDQLYAEG